jgi:hypothetical protein
MRGKRHCSGREGFLLTQGKTVETKEMEIPGWEIDEKSGIRHLFSFPGQELIAEGIIEIPGLISQVRPGR